MSTMTCRHRRSWGVLLLAGLATVRLGPPAVQAQRTSFQEEIDVNLVNVDVVVVDKKGNLISDLTREDFQVTDDGKKVEVSYFAPLGTMTAATGPDGSSAAPSADGGVGAGAVDPQHLVVFVDLDNQSPFSRQRVVGELAAVLGAFDRGGVRVMITTFGPKGLDVELPFSESPAEWEAALAEVKAKPGRGTMREMEQKRLIESLEEILRTAEGRDRNAVRAARDRLDQLIGSARVEAASVRADAQTTIRGMQTLASVLSIVPGQKSLLYVGDGVPIRPGQDMNDLIAAAFQSDQRFEQSGQNAASGASTSSSGGDAAPAGSGRGASEEIAPMTQSVSSLQLEGLDYDLTQDLRALAAIANSQRVTLYSVSTDAPGGTARADYNIGARTSAGVFQVYETSRSQLKEQSLGLLADETGGLSSPANTDVSGFLDRVLGDQQSRYSLGYVSPHGGDQGYHRIKVKVNRKGVRLRHREGYIDRARETEVGDLVAGALLLGTGENPHRMEMEVISQAPAENDQMAVSFSLRIPIDELHLVGAGDNQETKVDLYYLSKDAEGAFAPLRYTTFTIAIPSARMAEAKGQFYGATLPLFLEKGPATVAVGLVEPASRRTSVLRTELEVGGDG